MESIFLYGPPGSGKTSVGKILAARLSTAFIDLDEEIEKAAGLAIEQIITRQGQATFRSVERQVLKKVTAENPGVVALGGGALLDDGNRQLVESRGRVVFLDADFETLAERLEKDHHTRPLLVGNLRDGLRALLVRRKPHYESFRQRNCSTNRYVQGRPKTTEQIAEEIIQRLNLLQVHIGEYKHYDVLIEPGNISNLGRTMRLRELGNPVAVIADENVANLYAKEALESLRAEGYDGHIITFPPAEGSKIIETIMTLWQRMLEAGLERGSTVVALGGGVTGDLAGFAASTYMRGINWVGVPTSLLAMVDSSIGGKTGFDLPQGKNLIGSFHHPRLVLCDPDLLLTLPRREFAAGMAEVVKHGMVGDAELFAMAGKGVDSSLANRTELIQRAVSVKVRVVERDPYEQGLRAVLNLGHTIGHAVETASGYRLLHGEAIAIGLMAETRLAYGLGIAEAGFETALQQTLKKLDLPREIPEWIQTDAILKALRVDKKKSGEVVHFSLPVCIGNIKTNVAITGLGQKMELFRLRSSVENTLGNHRDE